MLLNRIIIIYIYILLWWIRLFFYHPTALFFIIIIVDILWFIILWNSMYLCKTKVSKLTWLIIFNFIHCNLWWSFHITSDKPTAHLKSTQSKRVLGTIIVEVEAAIWGNDQGKSMLMRRHHDIEGNKQTAKPKQFQVWHCVYVMAVWLSATALDMKWHTTGRI